ncbi:glycosyltransferase family 2 protein [Euzebya tangerina]|uniref:glycosyltransferase family 2 protein n=1 Tax=Euzebya tangerina TaxID=591198 RepID=UPI00196BA189|nr:glycosyltransferase family 2 protein [Euzebya tangerina]
MNSDPDLYGTLDVTVVLPALNEVGHIGAEVDRITKAMKDSPYTFEILVIDDGSTDGTGDAVEGLPFVRLMRFPVNRGSGTARRIGSQEAYGKYVVWTDADMTYPNERIPELIEILETGRCQHVVGARTTEEGTHKIARVPAKWAIRKLAEYLTGTKIPDLNSGLRAFKRSDALPYLGLLPTGFSCVTTITLSFLSNGLVVEYLPIEYAKRAGKSHFHPIRDAYRYMLQVVRMVTFFEPLRVFAPAAFLLLFLGVTKFVYDIVSGIVTDGDPFALSINTVLLLITGLILFSLGLLADLIVRTSRHNATR